MATIPQPWLFNWQQIDVASDLDRLKLVLSVLPDEELVGFLEERRGNGRDDYPIRPMWNVLMAGIVFQHASAASLIRELWRNAELRQLCGFDPLRGMGAAPTEDAFGRFLALVIEQRQMLTAIFHRLVEELGQQLPDLGEKLAVDSKAIASAGKPVKDEDKKIEPDNRRDLDADWGVKTYAGKRTDGTSWEKVVKWFGYKLHLLVDSTHELPLGFELTKASVADSPELLPLIEQLQEQHGEIAGRGRECAADKAYDSAENKAELYDQYDIKPVIDHRLMWKENPGQPRPLFGDRADVIMYRRGGA